MKELSLLREKINKTDEAILKLFEERMAIASDIALIKKEAGLPILNSEREAAVIERASSLTKKEELKPYSESLIRSVMDLSKDYQRSIISGGEITFFSNEGSYPIYIGEGMLANIDKLLDFKGKVAIVTDSAIPPEYAEAVLSKCARGKIFTVPSGEAGKSLDTYRALCDGLLAFGISRTDLVVAIGGGAVGDLAAFAAATYMRGVRFYNIPTTLLAMVDSSVGGKCGINFSSTKNIIGAFYPPKAVVIDTALLKTLPEREFRSGLAEIVKAAAILDESLFSELEGGIDNCSMEKIIRAALLIKKKVVEKDETEGNLRKILNFGHTVGHGIEALGERRHGECVALGMLPFASGYAKKRLASLLCSLGLSTSFRGINRERALEYIKRDKKGDGEFFDCVFVDEIGKCEVRKISFDELSRIFLEYKD